MVLNFLTTRARLILLIIAAALPAFVLSVYHGLERRSEAEATAREELERFAALAVQHRESGIEGVRQLLLALSLSAPPLMRWPEACSGFFKRIMDASGGLYRTMGVIGPDGSLVCNSAPWEGRIDSSDRRYFRLAMDRRQFAIGGYQIGRAGGTSGITFAFPMLDPESKPVGVVFARMSLAKLSENMAATPLPQGGMLTIYDHAGNVLVRKPEAAGGIGEKSRTGAVLEAIAANREGVFDALDGQGVPRVFAMKPAGINADKRPAFFIVVSIPKASFSARADRALIQTAGGILAATVLLILLAWFGAKALVLNRIERLLAVTRQVHEGDLTARTGFAPGREELSRLGAALDEMVQTLQDRDERLNTALRQLAEQATTDPLTGLQNRRSIQKQLEQELMRARRAQRSLAVILLDIDHFKRFNDTWGHQAGDEVLKCVAEVVRTSIRSSDIAGRYGGEELIAILPEATAQAALARAEAIRRGIETQHLEHAGNSLGSVAASFGVAVFPDHASDSTSLIRAADNALYEAKNSGRNRVVISGSNPLPRIA